MVPQWIIERKREGLDLTGGEIREFIAGYNDGTIPDYQMAALAMAIFFQGMSFKEVTTLTDAMMRSGTILDLSDLPAPTADKHSTGGIGDKISLMLAPLVATEGIMVPMISGRGLGITGGTLDKLESIPGYRVDLDTRTFRRIIASVGCSIIGQTSELAPADKKLYALRDVTATVPSIPLIAASIMSKKLAEGAGALVLDVKCGSGAFMKTREEAEELAETLVAIGEGLDRRMAAVITDMDQPLGHTVGNALEVVEAVQVLRNEGPQDTTDLTIELGAHMLRATDTADTLDDARERLRSRLADGSALEKFKQMIVAHGGDPGIADDPSKLEIAETEHILPSPSHGYVERVDADVIGRAALVLGAGRRQTTDTIDHSVGISHLAKVGDEVAAGQPLLQLHSRESKGAAEARKIVSKAFTIAPQPVETPPLFLDCVGEDPS